MTELERALTHSRQAFLGFIRKRVDSDAAAEDILQDSFLKALKAAPEFEDRDRMTTWIFRVIRNGIIDHYRRSEARQRSLEAYRSEVADRTEPTPEGSEELCACLKELLPSLHDNYKELILRLDLRGEASGSLAEKLNITRNNLKVRHHRARRQLRARLEEVCRTCAEHGCLDCTCTDHSAAASPLL